jgi:hypothetical protein
MVTQICVVHECENPTKKKKKVFLFTNSPPITLYVHGGLVKLGRTKDLKKDFADGDELLKNKLCL